MRTTKNSVVKMHLLRVAMASVIVLGLIGHALGEEGSTEPQPSKHDARRKNLESALATRVVRIEVEQGSLPLWPWPAFNTWQSIFKKNDTRSEGQLVDAPVPLIPEVEPRSERRAREIVAGIFLDKRGHLLTCLGEDPGLDPKLRVTFGEESLEATLKARDPESGVTLLEVENPPSSAAAVSFGAHDDGEGVLAAVPGPTGLSLVSVARSEKDAGESAEGFCASDTLPLGTPVVTWRGEVLGLVSTTTNAFTLAPVLGIAAPMRLSVGRMIVSDALQDLARQLETRGEVARGWLGANLRSLDIFEQFPVFAAGRFGGLRVTSITEDGPADKAGLRERDVIVSLDAKACSSPRAFKRRLDVAGPGKHVKLEVVREGKLRVIEAHLGEVPPK